MRVTIDSVGGLAGMARTVADYDTADLPPAEAAAVVEALTAIEAATARGESGEIGADLPGYRIVVDEPDARVYELMGELPSVLQEPLTVLLRPAS
jgi:hypothetical protein